ncbi:peptidogalycan biosysnthesis protein [Streptomyces sp. NPDC059949]|uniref:peptidogalycan biosysnthesis protein n=1 Tax=Streptomyces sp. NPDC059949 TaxID=3347013 RepID=UPI003652C715
MKTDITTGITHLPAAEWDHLARPAGLYLSHRWLAGEEADPTATAAYALVRDDDGTLLAAAPLYLVHTEPNSSYAPPEPAPGADRPRVVAGARRGYHSAPLTDPSLPADRRTACLALLRDAARTYAAGHGTTHWWPYLTEPAAALLAPLYEAAPRPVEEDALIPLPGAGFDDYLASLPKKRRLAVRRERLEFHAAGLRVRQLPLGDCFRDSGRLLAGLQQSHGHAADSVAAMTGLLERQAESMGDRARVAAAYDGRRMVAFGLYYHFGGTTWLRAVGTDPSCPAPFAYFNVAYYLPIEDGYREGTSALHAGMRTIRAKRLRGARVTDLYALPDA